MDFKNEDILYNTSILISLPGIIGLFFSERKYLCISSIFTSFISFLYWKRLIPKTLDVTIARFNYFHFLLYSFILSNLFHKFICWSLCLALSICYLLSCHFFYKNCKYWIYFHIFFHLFTTFAELTTIFGE